MATAQPVACWLWQQAPGYDIPERLREAQVAAALRAAQATTETIISPVVELELEA